MNAKHSTTLDDPRATGGSAVAPRQIFLAPADTDLARKIRSALIGRGHRVMKDSAPDADHPEDQLRAADAVIVLLTPDSIASERLRYQVELAQHVALEGMGLRILPIRVGYEGTLPFHLGICLDAVPYDVWPEDGEDDDSLHELCGRLTTALEEGSPLPHPGRPGEAAEWPVYLDAEEEKTTESMAFVEAAEGLFAATEGRQLPLPAADPRLTPQIEDETDIVRLMPPDYLKRPADDQLVEQVLLEEGTVTFVRGPHQSGKSSLLAMARAAPEAVGHYACYFDFRRFGPRDLEDLEGLCRALTRAFEKAFKTDENANDFWDANSDPIRNVTDFLEGGVLWTLQFPAILLFDEIDVLAGRSYCEPLFATFREWHEKRKSHLIWKRCDLVFAHQHIGWLRNLDPEFFADGLHLDLDDFALDDVAELNRRHGNPLSSDALGELHRLLGGHPYLVRRAFHALKDGWTPARLVAEADQPGGPFADHLESLGWGLATEAEKRQAFRQVLEEGRCDDGTEFRRLWTTGLVAGEAGAARPRCELYARYFEGRLPRRMG